MLMHRAQKRMQNSLSLHEISPHLAAISSSCITMPGHNQGDEVQPSPLCMCIRSSVALHSDVGHVPLCMYIKFTCVSGLVLPCIAMRGICEPE